MSTIEYTDKRTVELVKGLTLVPIVEDLETLDDLYDDYESLNALMKEVHEEENPVQDAAEPSSPLTKNPYGE